MIIYHDDSNSSNSRIFARSRRWPVAGGELLGANVKKILFVGLLSSLMAGCATTHYRPTFTCKCNNKEEGVRIWRIGWVGIMGIPLSDEKICWLTKCFDAEPKTGW